MDEKQANKWEKAREKGKKRFILIDGLLMGVTISVVWTIMQQLDILVFELKMDMTDMIVFYIVAPIIFIVFNALVWWTKEEEYKEYLEGGGEESEEENTE